MKPWGWFLFTVFAGGLIFAAGIAVGSEWTRRRIAEAIRFGELTVEQRVDHIADQIEAGPDSYIPVGYTPVGR